ncbi:MAG: hypothetical protein ABIP03_07260 [Aquihabitans sp.]
MTATPIRRRLTGPVLGLVLLLALTGCTGSQKTPESYTKDVRTQFIQGCQTTMTADVKSGASVDVSPKKFCTCAFDAISDKKTGIKFSEFKKLNEQLVETPGPIPSAFAKAFAGCEKPT